MAQQAELGPMHKNMQSIDNPIKWIDPSKWNCPRIDSFKTKADFFKNVYKESKCLLAEGGQSGIYTFVGNAKQTQNHLIVVKYYDITRKKGALQSAWTEFVFVKELKLLNYDQIYYSPKDQNILITSEPLNYTLRTYVETICKSMCAYLHVCAVHIPLELFNCIRSKQIEIFQSTNANSSYSTLWINYGQCINQSTSTMI